MTQNVQLKDINPETQNPEFLLVRENYQKVTLVLKWNLKFPREKKKSADEDIIQNTDIEFPKGEASTEMRSPEKRPEGS